MNTITGGNPSQGLNIVTCDIFAVVEAVEEAAVNNEGICGQHFGEEILAKMLNVAAIEEGPLIAAMDAIWQLRRLQDNRLLLHDQPTHHVVQGCLRQRYHPQRARG